MNKMIRYLLIILIGSIPVSMSFGQEKKMEQKIKIITDDGSGKVTVLDTTFADGKMPATIKLKNGKVINLEEKNSVVSHISTGEGKENINITVISDDGGLKKEEKKVIIMKGDSVKWNATPEKGQNIYVLNESEKGNGKRVSHVTVTTTGSGEKTYTITTEGDEKDENIDMTKYVVAKDGMVITVEGNDEAKAKEIIKLVEDKLNIKSDVGVKKEIVKTETKKTVKK